MLVTLEVLTLPSLRAGRTVLRARPDSGRPGEPIHVGAQPTSSGTSLFPPWPEARRPSLWSFLRRRDGVCLAIDYRRILVLRAYPDDQAPRRWVSEDIPAVESWRCLLRPVRTVGTIGGGNPLAGCDKTDASAEVPGVVITHAELPLRRFPSFFNGLATSTDAQHRSPGALCTFTSASFPVGRFEGFTVTCWRRLSDALTWARRDPTHRASMAKFSGNPSVKLWFARCVVVESEGQLVGRDPFAGVLSSTQGGSA